MMVDIWFIGANTKIIIFLYNPFLFKFVHLTQFLYSEQGILSLPETLQNIYTSF